MEITNILNNLTQAVITLGYVRFGIIVIINLILWRVDGLLGLIATGITIAWLLGLF